MTIQAPRTLMSEASGKHTRHGWQKCTTLTTSTSPPSPSPRARGEPGHVDEEKPRRETSGWENSLGCHWCRGYMFWQRIPTGTKESTVANQEESTMCSLIIQKIPIVKSVRSQKEHESGVGQNVRARGRDCASTTFGDMITTGYKILNGGNESRWIHTNARIVQDFTNWILSFPVKTKGTSETMWCHKDFVHTKISSTVTEVGKKLNRQFKRVYWSVFKSHN